MNWITSKKTRRDVHVFRTWVRVDAERTSDVSRSGVYMWRERENSLGKVWVKLLSCVVFS